MLLNQEGVLVNSLVCHHFELVMQVVTKATPMATHQKQKPNRTQYSD